MAEYIEREAVLDASDCFELTLDDDEIYFEYIPISAIKKIPAADVVPVRHGKWFISIGKDGDPVGTICSICGFAWSEALAAVMLMPSLSLIKTPYCPNCGAKMDGEA